MTCGVGDRRGRASPRAFGHGCCHPGRRRLERRRARVSLEHAATSNASGPVMHPARPPSRLARASDVYGARVDV